MNTNQFTLPFGLLEGGRYAFVLCSRGTLKIKREVVQETLFANYITPVLHPDKVLEMSEDCELHYFVFSKNILSGMTSHLLPIYSHIINHPQVEVKADKMELLVGLNGLLNKKRQEEETIYTMEILRHIELAILNEIYSIYQASMQVSEPEAHTRKQLVRDFFDLIVKHHREERHTAFYADKLCLTPKYLSLIIKRITSKSVNQWVNEVLISEIKLLLKTSDMTAQQISDYFNFPNSSFFGRFFKQHTGQTTKEFRLSA